MDNSRAEKPQRIDAIKNLAPEKRDLVKDAIVKMHICNWRIHDTVTALKQLEPGDCVGEISEGYQRTLLDLIDQLSCQQLNAFETLDNYIEGFSDAFRGESGKDAKVTIQLTL